MKDQAGLPGLVCTALALLATGCTPAGRDGAALNDGEGADPGCANVVCDAPPSQCHGAGLCRDGVCEYPTLEGKTCDDGNACTRADICRSGICGGTTLTCDSAPGPSCESADVSVVYDPRGACLAGRCEYTANRIGCPGVCGSATPNLCPDPCDNRTCAAPPSACFDTRGACDPQTGACSYNAKPAGTTCDDTDACTVSDQCDAAGACSGPGVTCGSPPPPTCVGSKRRVFAENGMCDPMNGSCSFRSTDVECPAGCANGACIATCDLTTCTAWSLPSTPDGTATRRCADALCTTTANLPTLDQNYYKCWVQTVADSGCAQMGCHGLEATRRRYRIYARSLSRRAPLVSGAHRDDAVSAPACHWGANFLNALSPDEWRWNYDMARLFALGAASPESSEFVTQPLAADAPGHTHGGFDLWANANDKRYQAVLEWLRGATETADCGGATLPTGDPVVGLNTY